MNKYWSPKIQQLEPYVPGEQPKGLGQLVKLNTNENPYPPSPRVKEAILNYNSDNLRLYCDPESSQLLQALAQHNHCSPDQVFVGNGSDEVLAFAFMAFFRQSLPILVPTLTYSFYQVYCSLFEIEADKIPLQMDFSINFADYRKPNGGIVFANPNAPTGLLTGLDTIRQLLDENRDSVVLVDEAYIDFGGESAAKLINQYDNLLVVNTFSKSHSLAGLRIGMAFGSPGLIEALNRVKNSFNSYPLDSLAQAAAAAAIQDVAYYEECNKKVIATRNWTSQQLTQLGFKVIPSHANFVFCRHPELSGPYLADYLRQRQIIVRHFNKPGIEDYLRITIGTDEQMQQLISQLTMLEQ